MNDFITSIATDQSSGLVSLVISRAADEIQLTLNLRDDIKELDRKLKLLQVILFGERIHDAMRSNPLIRSWLADVQSISYEAADLLDDYAWESFRRSLLPEKKSTTFFFSFLDCISSLIDPIIFRRNMAHRVKDLRISIEATYKEAQDHKINIKELAQQADQTESTTTTDRRGNLKLLRRSAGASDIIGRTDDINKIVESICDSKHMVPGGLHVATIVGMAGLGKTALLQSVSEDSRVKTCFVKRIWICVSYNFNSDDFLSNMTEQLTGENRLSHQEAILKNIKGYLKDESYLIMLDDVWDTMTEGLWDTIILWLKDFCGPLGSPTVLVTTRSDEVAKRMLSKSTSRLNHTLQELTKDDSWSLFCKNEIDCENMMDKSRSMVERCKGVPLAIKVLAKTLKDLPKEEWFKIEQDNVWLLDDDEGIIPSLRLSYDYLPNMEIKRCFEYCAIFVKDAKIEKDNLIQLWVAQGLISPSKHNQNDSLECIGDRYFNKLLNNSLFQNIEEDVWGNVRSCRMHDAVRALAQHVSRGEWITLDENGMKFNSDSKACHVRIGTKSNLDQFTPNKKVRTMVVVLTTQCSFTVSNILQRVKHLRVLCLVGMELVVFPSVVGELKHLRYLEISENKRFIELPNDALSNLWSLQTFRCLDYEGILFTTDTEWNKLVSIRHIVISYGILMPRDMNKLTCLQTVPSLYLLDAPGKISDLGPLTNISGTLELNGLEQVDSEKEASEALLGEKPDICELRLLWTKRQCASDIEEQVLKALHPHANLKVLKISYYMGKELPSWLIEMKSFGESKFLSLVSLNFKGCTWIKELPSSIIIQTLKFFEVEECHNLAFVNLSCFPSLVKIRIEKCINISIISTSFMNHTTLRSVKVVLCQSLTDMTVSYFPSLEKLHIKEGTRNFHMTILSTSLGFLRTLEISSFTEIINIDLNLFRSLEELTIDNGRDLDCIFHPDSDHLMLKTLKVSCCGNLKRIDVNNFPSLVELSISNCAKIPYLGHCPSCTFEHSTKVQRILISSCESLLVNVDLNPLQSLKELSISSCDNIELKIDGIMDLPNLQKLSLGPFNERLDQFPLKEELYALSIPPCNTSLMSLDLCGWKYLDSFPKMFQYCTVLYSLSIKRFYDLEELPEWLVNLKSLRKIHLWELRRLKYLPPRSNKEYDIELLISYCPLVPRNIPGYTYSWYGW